MELVLQQRQELNLSMTMELRQAIELLQYTTYELDQYIRQQELENPLIELKENEQTSRFEERISPQSGSYSASAEMPAEAIRSNDQNMRDDLFNLAKFTYPDEENQKLLQCLIYNLDENGYLPNDACAFEFNEEEIEKGIHLLQQLGPLGIGARSLQEYLLLQIQYSHPDHALAMELVKNHLGLIADRKWKDIARKLKITMSKVKELHDFILSLNPRPCSIISDFSTEYITPDIIVELKEGQLTFFLNDGYLPSIQLNQEYASHIGEKNGASRYLKNQHKKFQWLLSSIEQRRNTIIKIVTVLLDKQKSFFEKGLSFLQPLTLREVADEIDMHESTVSRATLNKSIQTPHGTFDMRDLFTSKLDMANGDSISQTKVKSLLKAYITSEDKFKPYSDQKIAEYFNTVQGISISRRTISKYREELHIPPSSKRKEIKV